MDINIRKRKRAKGDVYEYYFTYQGQRFSKSGYKTRSKAIKDGQIQLAKLMTKTDIKEALEEEKKNAMTLNALIKEFLPMAESQYSPNTVISTKRVVNQIGNLGKMPLYLIDFKTMQTFFDKRSKKGYRSNENCKKYLSRIFKYGIAAGYIDRDPTLYVKITGVDNSRERQILTDEQLNMLLDNLSRPRRGSEFRNKMLIIAIKLGYYMGLRISEACALVKSDFDLDRKEVIINKKLIYQGLKSKDIYVQHKTKSKKSKAVLPIPDVFIPELKKWFEENPYDIVLPSKDGHYVNPISITVSIDERCKRHFGFRFNYHSLRHSYATNLVMNNVDLKVAQELMRHVKIDTTLSIYTHIQDQAKFDAVNSVFKTNKEKEFIIKKPKVCPKCVQSVSSEKS